VSHVKKKNGGLCRHPQSARLNDLDAGEVVCQNCGEVLQRRTNPIPLGLGSEKFGRGPENAASFRGNLGTTSKLNGHQKGPEHAHLYAVKSIYGSRGSSGSMSLIKTCPACSKQQPVKIFNDGGLVCENQACGVLECSKCDIHGHISDQNGWMRCSNGPRVSEDLQCAKFGEIKKHIKFLRTQLGQYVLRWCPSNNGNSRAISFWADLRGLQAWDPPEGDPNVKAAREILREQLLNKVTAEQGHRIASAYLAAVKKISHIPKRTLTDMLSTLLESEQVRLEN
jgi:hypothetical protein